MQAGGDGVPATVLLEVRHLRVLFHSREGDVPAVDDVSLVLGQGETLGLVGESGCGKTTVAHSIMRLLQPPAEIVEGEILWEGSDLRKLSSGHMRRLRGRKIALILQEPGAALNPFLKIGTQLVEGMQAHLALSRREAWERAVELLQEVGIPEAAARMHEYPHQFSGGMRQRALIAMALSCHPSLIIADEPTSALDVRLQAQILDLLFEVKERYALSILLISHDLGVIAQAADRIAVMQEGRIVECGTAQEIFYHAAHPYTRKLLSSVPRM